MIQVGDKFIYRSKYGGITEGVIGNIFTSRGINSETGYIHKTFSIQSTNNIAYSLNEIEIVERKATDEELERFKKVIEAIQKLKNKKENHKKS
jgi:hypothetical protein